MTCIAWDGKTLAADKRSTCAGYPSTVTKIYRVPGGLVGFAGSGSHASALLEWFGGGKDPEKWPVGKDGECDAIFISKHGEVFGYSGKGGPHQERYENRFVAMGSGRDYALAAMHLGHSAKEAVEVACALDVFCGNGIDVLELWNDV